MMKLLAGLVLFHAIHIVPMRVGLRQRLVTRLGQSGYLGLFTVVSLVSLALIVMGYGEARQLVRDNPQLWSPPAWTRHLAYLLMLPAILLLIAAYVPSRIRDAAQHPMLAAMKLWALAHLLVRGDLASLLLFGSFLVYAVIDRISVARRSGGRGPLGEARGTMRGDAIVLVVGLAAYAGLLFGGHAALIGVSLAR